MYACVSSGSASKCSREKLNSDTESLPGACRSQLKFKYRFFFYLRFIVNARPGKSKKMQKNKKQRKSIFYLYIVYMVQSAGSVPGVCLISLNV